jgi:hypothetical protein
MINAFLTLGIVVLSLLCIRQAIRIVMILVLTVKYFLEHGE